MSGQLRVVVDPSLIRIDLTIPGSESFLELIRAVVGRAARLAGFSFDGIEDLSLVADEAATLLLRARPEKLDVHLIGFERGLEARMIMHEPRAPWPPDGLTSDTGWQVLTTLCEQVRVLDGKTGIGLKQQVR